MKPSHRIAIALGVLFVALAPASASADWSPEAKRLHKKRDAERYDFKTRNSSIRTGGARVHVAAPVDVVQKVVTDYNRWGKHIKKIQKARVVGKKGKHTDVYLQVPFLKGIAKIWGVVRFDPPKTEKNGDVVIRARLLKGNVDKLDATVRISKIDDKNSQLSFELLMVPSIPIPSSLITSENAYAADEAVMGLRNRSEKKRRARRGS